MKFSVYLYSAILALFLMSCTSLTLPKSQPTTTQNIDGLSSLRSLGEVDLSQAVMSQTIYVPTYSYIYYENDRRSINLTTTLSIRNTDLTHPIIITSVRYYNTKGELISQYLAQPAQLDPLASVAFVIDRTNITAGLGASFIVEWMAKNVVTEPIVEAVMIGTDFSQGISFVSPGKVIKSYQKTTP